MSKPLEADVLSALPQRRPLLSIFLVSVLGLFVELMLIRWVATEIRIFAYLQNTVLVVCFLGLGMGCWTCRQPIALRQVLLPLTALTCCLGIPWIRLHLDSISQLFASFMDFMIWNQVRTESTPSLALGLVVAVVLTLVMMLLLWEIFVPLGRLLGRLLDQDPHPIRAYSANVAGSLAGIGFFVLLSAAHTPPWVWCLVAILLLLPFWRPGQWADLGLLALLAVCGFLAQLPSENFAWQFEEGQRGTSEGIVWSPYQKLDLRRLEEGVGHESLYVHYGLLVNNTPYMRIFDLSPAAFARWPKVFPPELRGLSQYDLPCLVKPRPRKMLVVGSGAGNDVAGGLRGQAEHIVAVEIDPAILRIGRDYHPEQPYAAPQVEIINDDARAYFATTTARFDLIVFGLLDSHTTTSMTNARLDHYVYTRESIQQAKRLLKPEGVMVLSFEAQKPFITDRIARVLREEFAQEPLCFRVPLSSFGFGGVYFIVGDMQGVRQQIAAQPRLAAYLTTLQQTYSINLPGTTPVTTDDWPYLYLEYPRIPFLFYVLGGMMAVLAVIGWWRVGKPNLRAGWHRDHWHFFFLGAAFMLLETQNISKAAVVLGNTWDVNAVIIAAILILILLSNFIASWLPRLPLLPVYASLIAVCLSLYFVDLAQFSGWPYATKALVVGGLTCLPMLFSGIIFIRSFAQARGKDLALGANLLGALVGGLLQCVTYWTGIQALLLIVAGLYFTAFLLRPRAVVDTESIPATTM